MRDFFISYNKADREWAEWIGWHLEEAGYTVIVQDWDFRPGGNFVVDMQRAASDAERTIAVLSPDYLSSSFGASEWTAAFAQDPTGVKGVLLPVRVRECNPTGLLPQIVYIDLVGKKEPEAKAALLAGIKRGRAKPTTAPGFPVSSSSEARVGTETPRFPAAPGSAINNTVGVSAAQPTSQIEALARNVSYDNPVKARKNIQALKAYVLTLDSLQANEAAITLMKDVLFQSLGGNPIPGNVRQVRQEILACIRALKTRDLCFYFQNGELESLDLFGMDFAGENLGGVSFKNAFLVETNFASAILDGADFSYSSLRNVDFTDAQLARAKFTEADWFNAVGLTIGQLESAKKGTLSSCPKDTAGFHAELKQRYSFPFESWEKQIQDQLTNTWKAYLKKGGLCRAVSSWKPK